MDADPQHRRQWKFSPSSDSTGPETKSMDSLQFSEEKETQLLQNAAKGEPQSVVTTITNDRIWQERLDSISEKSRIKIQQILDEIHLLLPVELMLLYLKLPAESKDPPDPLRQPLNPLGSRSEICQTITWIRTHLEEDPDISLQKKGVYEEYRSFCELNSIKCLSTADFGKVMKQVYPRVRPRRLGTRGNSQYCYSGLRKRLGLPTPILPDLSDRPQSTEMVCSKNDLSAAAWTIVKEWSESQLGMQFCSLHSLAFHLVVKCSIGVGSAAASIVTSVEVSQSGTPTDTFPQNFQINKHKEMTLQLQRKIQAKNCPSAETSAGVNGKEIKRKTQSQSPKVDQKMRTKKCKVTQNQLFEVNAPAAAQAAASAAMVEPQQPPHCLQEQQQQTLCDKSLEFSSGSGIVSSSTGSLGIRSPTVINNQLRSLPDFSSFHRQQSAASEATTTKENESLLQQQQQAVGTPVIEGKVPIPRLLSLKATQQQQPLPSLPSSKRNNKGLYKAIQPKPVVGVGDAQEQQHQPPSSVNDQSCDNVMYKEHARSQQDKTVKRKRKRTFSNGISSSHKDNNDDLNINNDDECKKEITECIETSFEDDGEPIHFSRERLESISKVSKDEIECYLGNNNSQEEEELEKYFENNNVSSQSQPVLENNQHQAEPQHQFSQQDPTVKQLSQVRQLLEQQNIGSNSSFELGGGGGIKTLNSNQSIIQGSFKSVPTTPLPMSTSNQQLFNQQQASNVRRRVSFDTHNFVCEEVVPRSPNTRCKNLNFTPISPGPKSPPGPTGRHSKNSSNNASPFVSPRNTPIPRLRMNPYQNNNNNNQLNNQRKIVNVNVNVNTKKLRPELELKLDGEFQKNSSASSTAMSAPPSPKMSKSNLLQSLLQSKITYTPEYNMQVPVHNQTQHQQVVNEASSPEIWRLVGNVPEHGNMDAQFRSQSVPLPTIPDPCFTHFPFDVNPQSTADSTDVSNDFNDIDTFATTDNLNVSKIIDSIDLDTNNINMDVVHCDSSRFDLPFVQHQHQHQHQQEQVQTCSSSSSSTSNSRWLTRTQSLDVDNYNNSMKCPSSRSVPATPIPYGYKRNLSQGQGEKSSSSMNNSRSYPSTPMTNETFTYSSQGQDFLLNGQPIKEKIALNTLSYVTENQDQAPHPQLHTSSFQEIINEPNEIPTSEETCEIIGVGVVNADDYTFEGVSDLNGT